MELITSAQREKLLANGANRGADHMPVVKLFNPCGAGTWLVTELDPEDPPSRSDSPIWASVLPRWGVSASRN